MTTHCVPMYQCCVGPSARVVALDHDFSREQLSGLGTARARLMAADIHVEIWRCRQFSGGIAAYGLWPSANIEGLTATAAPGVQLQPALTWRARGSQARRIAVLPVGYHEGFPRARSNHGHVLVRGLPGTGARPRLHESDDGGRHRSRDGNGRADPRR